MAEFDPIRAAKEELSGLHAVLTTMVRRENAAEMAMGLAEEELNAIRKLRGYAQMQVEAMQERIRKLEEAANNGS
jgi:hypothetical protein